jgi:hypothetical protein
MSVKQSPSDTTRPQTLNALNVILEATSLPQNADSEEVLLPQILDLASNLVVHKVCA